MHRDASDWLLHKAGADGVHWLLGRVASEAEVQVVHQRGQRRHGLQHGEALPHAIALAARERYPGERVRALAVGARAGFVVDLEEEGKVVVVAVEGGGGGGVPWSSIEEQRAVSQW